MESDGWAVVASVIAAMVVCGSPRMRALISDAPLAGFRGV